MLHRARETCHINSRQKYNIELNSYETILTWWLLIVEQRSDSINQNSCYSTCGWQVLVFTSYPKKKYLLWHTHLLVFILRSLPFWSSCPSLYQRKEGLGFPDASHFKYSFFPSIRDWLLIIRNLGAEAGQRETRDQQTEGQRKDCIIEMNGRHSINL